MPPKSTRTKCDSLNESIPAFDNSGSSSVWRLRPRQISKHNGNVLTWLITQELRLNHCRHSPLVAYPLALTTPLNLGHVLPTQSMIWYVSNKGQYLMCCKGHWNFLITWIYRYSNLTTVWINPFYDQYQIHC